MKKWLVLLALLAAAVAGIRLFGGCDLNARLCSSWCSVRHIDSDVKAAACKAGCTAEKAACLIR